MSEDISAQVRVGGTIILVAALLAVVLNLMVVAQNVLSAGMSTLQSGTQQIAMQEFEAFNQKTKTGTEVKSAMTLYLNRDIAIMVKPRTLTTADTAYCYGAQVITTVGQVQGSDTDQGASGTYVVSTSGSTPTTTLADGAKVGTYYLGSFCNDTGAVANGTNTWSIGHFYDTQGTVTNGDPEAILDSGRFQSTLMKDVNGAIIGIYFEQQ